MNIEIWPIDRPKDCPRNARKWSAQAIAKVGASIREYGWRQSVVVDSKEVIAIGHLRRAAGKSIGLTECPVHVASDLTPQQIRGLRLADNRTNQESVWDDELLSLELQELAAADFNLELTGFDPRELEELLTLPENDEQADIAPPLPKNPVSRLGDLWAPAAAPRRHSMPVPPPDPDAPQDSGVDCAGCRTTRIAHCRREIAAIEAQLRAGHPDVAGLCLALADWHAELRLILGLIGS